jgi:Conserved hypothetical protein (DUF2461)
VGVAAGGFSGWKGDFTGFFLGLRANNNKPYFEAHRKQYELEVKAPMLAAPSCLAAEPRHQVQRRQIALQAEHLRGRRPRRLCRA